MRVDPVGLDDLDIDEPSVVEKGRVLLGGQRPGNAAGPACHVLFGSVVHVGVGDDVAHGKPAVRAQDAGRLADDGRLVGGQVDDAVGDDDVDRRVGEGDVLDLAREGVGLAEARIRRPSLEEAYLALSGSRIDS